MRISPIVGFVERVSLVAVGGFVIHLRASLDAVNGGRRVLTVQLVVRAKSLLVLIVEPFLNGTIVIFHNLLSCHPHFRLSSRLALFDPFLFLLCSLFDLRHKLRHIGRKRNVSLFSKLLVKVQRHFQLFGIKIREWPASRNISQKMNRMEFLAGIAERNAETPG